MLTPDERSLIDVNINPSDLVGGTNFSVISKIGTQIVAGVKYKLLLEMHVAGIANPESSYVIADVLVGADGTVTPDLTTAFTISME